MTHTNLTMRFNKYHLILLLFFQSLITLAQNKNFVAAGIITMKTNATIGFEQLYFVNEKVAFKNVATNAQTVLLLADIYKIEDDAQHTAYQNSERQKLVAAAPVAEVINDTLYRPDYPEGIYETKEDFIAKKPTYKGTVRPKGLVGLEKPLLTTIEHSCFFYDMQDEKIKRVFAISYKGHLYFQISAILSNRNKTDRAQTTNFTNGFVRVIMGGKNYFYTEVDLANQWAQAVMYGGIGGGAGGILAQSMVYGKGVVWDFKNNEFNIFKNCKDYNAFIQPLSATDAQQCKNNQPDVWAIRKAIEKVK